VIGSPRSHRGLAGHLARAADADVYLPEYRLAPEHPHPAATDDLFSAYRAVLERGHDPARVAIGGDSAGGALTILTALAIREMDLPSPAAMVLIAPVTDLAASGASMESKASAEPLLRRSALEGGYRDYAGPLALTDPRISPLYADLHGLPPTLIQVGEDEILLDDSLRFADRAWGAGVEVELQRFPGLWHDFQVEAALLRDAADAVGDIGAFLRRRWEV
jgi:monoterpene epsilon-lactone hydrolase